MEIKLKRSTRRFLAFCALLPIGVLILAEFYYLGMRLLEGQPRTYLQSLQWAAETITTTGYGHDSEWHHPAMAVYVILGQFVGQFLVFLIFPVIILPYFEEQFESRLPHVLPKMAGTVLFYRYGPAIESLVAEFAATKTPFVIFEEDLERAHYLRDLGYDVVFGKLSSDPGALKTVQQARAVVANAGDHDNATCTLVVRELGYEGPIYALAQDPLYRPPMLQIGATDVFTPAHVLGGALASHASTRISPPAEGMHLLGTEVGLAEFRVSADSPIAGRTLRELRLRERHGVSVIGQWVAGEFATTRGPETAIAPGAILVVVGAHANLEQIERTAMPIRREGPVVIAGYGAVGQKVAEMLRDAGEHCVVVDQAHAAGVDVVGSALDRATLERAGVQHASAVVLALSDDSESIFVAAVVRDFAPQVPMIVRVQRTRNTARLYRAGADFAISLGEVTGKILAFDLLGEQAVQVESRIKFVRVHAGALAGAHPWRHDALDRTGAKVIAVERAGEVLVEFGEGFAVDASDDLFVCGSTASLERFQRAFHAKLA